MITVDGDAADMLMGWKGGVDGKGVLMKKGRRQVVCKERVTLRNAEPHS